MDILLNTITKAMGWTIIHSLWQGAMVYILLVGLLKLYPKMNSGSKYNLSFSAMLGIFGWALFTFSNEFARFNIPVGSAPATGISSSIADRLHSLIDRSIPLLVIIYLTGICFHVSFLIFDFYKVNRLRTIGLIDLGQELKQKFSELACSMGITRKVQFNLSVKVTVPIVVGYLKPIILLPVSVVTQLDSKQLESIVIHELSHIRRNDYLLNLLKVFMETVLFFNPFVLMAGKIINIEREQACDDLVIEMTNDPIVYAESLLEIQKLKFNQDRFSLAITGKNHHLLNRITRLTNGDVTNSTIKQPLALFLIVASFFLLAWIPVELKNSKDPVSAVKKNEQSKKTPVREKSEKQKLPDAPKSTSKLVQNEDVTPPVTEKKAKPDKLSEVIVAGPHRTDGADNNANQLISVSNMPTIESGSQAKEKPNIVIQTSDVEQISASTNTSDNRETPLENPSEGQQKTAAPENQQKTVTGYLKPDNAGSGQQRPSTFQTRPAKAPSNEPIIAIGFPSPK